MLTSQRWQKIGLWLAIILIVTLLSLLAQSQNLITVHPLMGQPLPAQDKLFSSALQKRAWAVINFWKVDCVSCRAEALHWRSFVQAVEPARQNIILISINVADSDKDIKRFKDNFLIDFPIIADQQALIAQAFNLRGTPETFIADPQQIVRYHLTGETNKSELLRIIEQLKDDAP